MALGVGTPNFDRRISLLIKSHGEYGDEEQHQFSLEHISERKTRITCTLGPSVESVENLCKLLKAGMNVARFNFSHGSHDYHGQVAKNLREAIKLTGLQCALLLDTKGPEIRTGLLKDGKTVKLIGGQPLDIHVGVDMKTFQGDNTHIALDYAGLCKAVKPGSIIKMADGLIHCTVQEVNSDANIVRVRVENTCEIGQRKNCNLPGVKVDLPALTEQDKKDLGFAVTNHFDFIAASFTRRESDVKNIREVLEGHGGPHLKIICKIENQEGLDNFDAILAAADGIMVARGDLGVEIPIQRVCMWQKLMIRKCNLAGKPVITATQMMESMVENPRPTRAEATDIANAVFDGTDAVMLSGETARGAYPFDAVEIMGKICRSAEKAMDYPASFLTMVYFTKKPINRSEAITSSAVKTAMDLDCGAIIVLTESGSSARYVSKYKPSCPVIVLTKNEISFRQCLVSRALFPLFVDEKVKSEDEDKLIALGVEFGRNRGWLKTGDSVVVVSGMVAGVSGGTNMMKVLDVK